MSLPEKGDERLFGLGQELAGGGEVAFGQFPEHRHLHLDLGQVPLVFEGRAGGGADHVAEIVEGAARHDRVQVHHAHGLAGAGCRA